MTLYMVLLVMGIGLQLLAQTTPPEVMTLPPWMLNVSALTIVAFVVWRVFMVELPENRETVRQMATIHGQAVAALVEELKELRKDLSANTCLTRRDEHG